jgi:hypothetical protein
MGIRRYSRVIFNNWEYTVEGEILYLGSILK